jgi:anti-sigma factor RsiW
LQRLVAAVPPEVAALALALAAALAVALHADGRPLRQPLDRLLPLRASVRHPIRVGQALDRPPSLRM